MAVAPNAIISIRPKFAQSILSGKKTVELRRRIPRTEVGTRLWIYATRPSSAIVGYATVKDIVQSSPNKLWKQFGEATGITKSTYDEYFEGTNVAVAIVLTRVKEISPVSIEKLRSIRRGFHPPQVMVRITESEGKLLKEKVKPK